MLDDFIFEFKMHRLLKKLAKQRVRIILEPGVPLIERAVGDDEETNSLLLTAELRGWVEILHENIPSTKISISDENDYSLNKPIIKNQWKLTDSGWAAIQRTHSISIFTLALTIIGILLTVES